VVWTCRRKDRASKKDPALIILEKNMFVQCYFILYKKRCAQVGIFVARLEEALMCALKIDITEQADILDSL
jgi:hypothetical protein